MISDDNTRLVNSPTIIPTTNNNKANNNNSKNNIFQSNSDLNLNAIEEDESIGEVEVEDEDDDNDSINIEMKDLPNKSASSHIINTSSMAIIENSTLPIISPSERKLEHQAITTNNTDNGSSTNNDVQPIINNNFISNSALTLYEAWIGNNTLCCQGKLILGPDRKLFIITLVLIFIAVIVWPCVVLPHFLLFVHVAVGVVFIVVAMLGLACMISESIEERNHLLEGRRRENEKEEEEEEKKKKPEPPMYQKVNLKDGRVIELKYCATCEIYRPPRSSHCRRCDNCVEKFDHHCPWTGTCIGRRNYRSFILFIFSTTITSWFVIATCIVHTVLVWIYYFDQDKPIADKVGDSFRYSIGGIVIGVYIFLSQFFVGSLTVFHSYLISTGQTTYEYVNKTRRVYNRGLILNWFYTLFNITECGVPSKARMGEKLPIQVYTQNILDYSKATTSI
ncbi:hypothetical protein ABK040_009611 [Willaertia magna]